MENMSKMKKLRLEKGLTQEQLFKKIDGISLRTLQRIEKDPYNCKLETAKMIAKALDTTVDKLFFDFEEVGDEK